MKDPMLFNKIAAAGLTALLIFFGLPQVAKALRGGAGHHGADHGELKLAYPIDWQTALGGAGAEEAAEVVDLGALLAAASPAAGERRAALCKSCHTFEKGGADGTGPNLWGVVGRPVASHAGFAYSAALKSAGGAWTYERLDQYIANSQAFMPGTAMMQRFPKADQRAEILAYLSTLSDSPAAFPPPLAAAAPAADATAQAPSEPAAGETAPVEAAEPAPAQ